MRHRRLATNADLADGLLALTQQCEIMRTLHDRNGVPPLRKIDASFAGLAKIVVEQQVSAQSAAAIWSRVAAGVRPCNAETVARMPDKRLSELGLSAGKVKTLKALAKAVRNGEVDLTACHRAPDEAVIAQLTAVHGIGPWTADIYLLFALRRADAFAAGDLAMQIAAQRLFALDARPHAGALTELAERWRPWRGIAARMLWADYSR
ncbi:MAG: DNA-3-methyladenine glycosylase 2 family protein [Hyphomicrobium sp.]|nr:DNA-3-methyladenine glycosylase 2 family protein [Hyphomicrobium sp.]